MKLLLTVVTGDISHINSELHTFCNISEHEVPEGVKLEDFVAQMIRQICRKPYSRKSIMSVSHSLIP